jgi:hypothetical protein
MSDAEFFGTYTDFSCPDRKAAAGFMGSDNLVGDPYTIEMDYESGQRTAWIVNPFGFRMGVISEKIAQKIDVFEAKGWKTVALLACVGFTEEPKPGNYWGQVVILSYSPEHAEAFDAFTKTIGEQLSKGIRPAVNLGKDGISRVLQSKGTWIPTGRVPLPKEKKGSMIFKKERSSTDKLVAQARKSRIGCTVVSWGFVIIVVAAIIFAMHSCGAF